MFKFRCIFAVLLMISVFLSAPSYGYGINDPLIIGFKKVIKHLKNQDWKAIQSEVKTLEPQIKNANIFLAAELQKKFDNSIDKKSQESLATTWITLTASSCRIHLWWNLHDDLKDRNKSKARIDSINRLFKDVLGAPIKNINADLHKKIALTIAELRDSLGSPGVFGIGKVDTDHAKFFDHCLEFENLLFEIFPDTQAEWTKKITKENALTQARIFLNNSKRSKNFTMRYSALSKALNALQLLENNTWKTPFRKLYPLMGAPAEGKASEKAADNSFAAAVDNILKEINK